MSPVFRIRPVVTRSLWDQKRKKPRISWALSHFGDSCLPMALMCQWAKREVIRNNIEPYIELDLKSGFLLGFYTDSVDEKLLQMAELWGLISDADKDFLLNFAERIRAQNL